MRAITSPLFSRLVSPSPPSPSPCSNPSLPLCALLSTSYLFWNSPTLSVVYRKLLEHFFSFLSANFDSKLRLWKTIRESQLRECPTSPSPPPPPRRPSPFLSVLLVTARVVLANQNQRIWEWITTANTASKASVLLEPCAPHHSTIPPANQRTSRSETRLALAPPLLSNDAFLLAKTELFCRLHITTKCKISNECMYCQ